MNVINNYTGFKKITYPDHHYEMMSDQGISFAEVSKYLLDNMAAIGYIKSTGEITYLWYKDISAGIPWWQRTDVFSTGADSIAQFSFESLPMELQSGLYITNGHSGYFFKNGSLFNGDKNIDVPIYTSQDPNKTVVPMLKEDFWHALMVEVTDKVNWLQDAVDDNDSTTDDINTLAKLRSYRKFLRHVDYTTSGTISWPIPPYDSVLLNRLHKGEITLG